MSVERVIGIDFGTSTSVVKVKTYKDDMPLDAREMSDYVRFDNKASLPTLVYKTIDGKHLIGYEAENAAVKGTLCQNFKLNLVSPDEEIKKEAIFYTELFFKYLYDEYANQKSYFPACDSETTYVSYPAKWSEDLRSLMIGIAVKAGFKNVKGLDEPTAAIHTVMVQECERLTLNHQNTANILMIDMGAGTTDLVLCRFTPDGENRVEIINTWPDAGSQCLFGGREIDEALCEYIKDYLTASGLPNAGNFKSKYLDKCKTWKENNVSPVLREKDGVVRFCGFIDALLAMLDVDSEFPPLSRETFENMLSPYLSQFPQLVKGCLEDAGFDKAALDYVILTGGHSQWYFANEIVAGTLTRFGNPGLPQIEADPKRIIKLAIPQETVAAGLVYQKLNVMPGKSDSAVKEKAPGSTGPAVQHQKTVDQRKPFNPADLSFKATPPINNSSTRIPNGQPTTSASSIQPSSGAPSKQPTSSSFSTPDTSAIPPSATSAPSPKGTVIRSVECRMAGIGANLFELAKGVKKENEASIYAVTGVLNLYEDQLEFAVNVHKHPTYSKNKNIILLYSLIKGIKKKYASAFTAEETMLSVIPYVALGKMIANGNKSISIQYNLDAEYILTFGTKNEADEMLALISRLIGRCKGR
ncbi:MAG: Hsp70 family protein [Clostridia bacterium]|nr:Hsp70 family protein [Clostridia bacterium]